MKFLKILGIVLGIFVLLIVAATVAAKIIFTKEKILGMVIPRVEETLHRKVSVRDASLSIFPSVSLNIEGLVIKNKPGYQQENLISLEELSLKLKLLPLLRKRIELGKLVLVKPEIYLEKVGEKQSNYQDFLQSDKEKKIIPVTFDRLEIKEARTVYYNRPEKATYVIEGLNQEGKLSLVGGRYLETSGKLTIKSLQLKNSQQALAYPVELTYKASYDLIADSLKITEGDIKFAGLLLKSEGKIEGLTRQPKLNFQVQTDEIPLSQLIASLPEAQKKSINGWKSSGTIKLQARGACDFSSGFKPSQLKGELSGKDIVLTSGPETPPISIPLLSANFSESNLNLATSGAKVGEAPLRVGLMVDNFEDPNLSGDVSVDLDLALLPKLVKLPEGSRLSGRMDLAGNFSGKFKILKALNLTGTCALKNVNYSSPNLPLPVSNLNGKLKVISGELRVENLSAQQGKSSFAVSGSCPGLVAFVLAEKGKKEAKKPTFNFSLTSAFLNLDEILPSGDTSNAKTDTASSAPAFLGLAIFINFQGHLKIERAIFREVEFTDFSGDLSISDGVVKLSNVTGKVYSGTAAGEATCDLRDPGDIKFEIKSQATGLDANQFLSRFSDIQNRLYGKLNFQGNFTGQGNSVPRIQNSLAGEGKVNFTDGKLVNWEFAEKLGSYLNLKEFDQEEIKELKNNFVIRDSRLVFENFTASSKKADWKLAGSVGLLDQSLDYSLSIFLSPEVSGQITLLGENAKFLKDDKGRLLIPLKITGTAGAPVFALDFSLVSQKLQNQLQKLQDKKEEGQGELLKKGKEALEGLFKKKKDG